MPYSQILLIDDDEDDWEIFVSALDVLPWKVACTAIGNPRAALQGLIDGTLLPELIFVDLNMPLMNGVQLLQLIKEQQNLKDIPVIMLSTSARPDTVAQVRELGAADFVTKPDKLDDLIAILRTIIGNEG